MEQDAAVVRCWVECVEMGIMAAEDLTTKFCQKGILRCAVGNLSAGAQHIL